MHLKEMVMRRREVWTEKIDNGNTVMGSVLTRNVPIKSGLVAPVTG